MKAEKQYAFRHIIVEKRLLNLAGEAFRQKLIPLKTAGIKTEAVFVQLFNLSAGFSTDPYQAILALQNRTDQKLISLLREAENH